MSFLEKISNAMKSVFGGGKKKRFTQTDAILQEAKNLGLNEQYREGVIRTFHAIADFGANFMGNERGPGMTARQYLMELTKDVPTIDPEEIDFYATKFEIARYSDLPVSSDDLEESIESVRGIISRIQKHTLKEMKSSKRGDRRGTKTKRKAKVKARARPRPKSRR